VTIYNLLKFVRSNQNTCFNHRPIVEKGQFVFPGRRNHRRRPCHRAGRTRFGEKCDGGLHALGRIQLRGLDPCQRTVGAGRCLHLVHIEEFEVVARDTKLGKEDITRDIPNVGEEALKDLDDSGIIRLGAEVEAGRHPRW
jgi:DNA-directed RNA polymerase subunit beta